jgi:hypothetical protein
LQRRTYAITTIPIVIALLVFLYAPLVPAQRKLIVTPTSTVTVQDYASASYALFGFGTTPFTGDRTYKTTVNGTEAEVMMKDGLYNVSIGGSSISKARVTDLHLQLLVNTAQFNGSTLLLTLKNTGSSKITSLSIETAFSGRFDCLSDTYLPVQSQSVSISPNETQTVSFLIYASPPLATGNSYPISIYGSNSNSSAFRYYATVEAS